MEGDRGEKEMVDGGGEGGEEGGLGGGEGAVGREDEGGGDAVEAVELLGELAEGDEVAHARGREDGDMRRGGGGIHGWIGVETGEVEDERLSRLGNY